MEFTPHRDPARIPSPRAEPERAVRRLFLRGWTAREIAEELGRSEDEVRRTLLAPFETLLRRFAKRGCEKG